MLKKERSVVPARYCRPGSDLARERTRKERSVVPARYCRPGSDLVRQSVPRATRPQQYVVGSYMPAVDEWEDQLRFIPVSPKKNKGPQLLLDGFTASNTYFLEDCLGIDNPLAKKPAQKQISEQPRAGGAPMVGSGTTISSSLFCQLCGSCLDRAIFFTLQLHIYSIRTYPGSLSVRLAARWQWPGQEIEQAAECRAVVGILGESGITAAEGYNSIPPCME
ncbi:hypothetical protein J6590_000457 [Homalodisca vitripennis]|nr:hypothetical protein J6590_000457 [Homalodisca vitripennis]